MKKIDEIWIEGIFGAAKKIIESDKSLGIEVIVLPVWEEAIEKILEEINKNKGAEERNGILTIWHNKSAGKKQEDLKNSDYSFTEFVAQITSHPLLARLAASSKN